MRNKVLIFSVINMKLVLAGFSVFAAVALGQNPRPVVVDQQLASVANLPSHKIAPSDLLALSVYDAPELTRTIRVSPDGTIQLPLLKSPVRAEGLFPNQLEAAVAEALKADQVLLRPLVTVTIMEYNNRNVSVMGAVHKPLTFEVIGATRLMDALARAEGITQDAGPELLLARVGEASVTRINVRQLMSGADQSLNFLLEGGEEIRIPDARKIYVVGNVKKPGAVPIRDGSESSVLKLLAAVEGLAPYAQSTAWIYRVDQESTRRQEIPVDLKKILARKAPDVNLRADDILYIPDAVNKRAAVEAAKVLMTTGSGAISAFVYAGVH
jgi:polysaccharide export outer membrane protein